MAHRITLIPGDGIGPEVTDAARTVVAAAGVDVEWDVQEAGAALLEREGTPLPGRVLASIRANRVALKGPIATPVGTGFRSVNVALRQDLDLFASVRPILSLPGVRSRYRDVDLVIVRENTEDLYAGIEFSERSEDGAALQAEIERLTGRVLPPRTGITVKPISVTGTNRIVRFAFDLARQLGRRRVTLGHKATIMRHSDGVFLEYATREAASHPDIGFEPMEIDEMASTLVLAPETLDVLLLPNLYGDIMSDLCAGLVGGLGLAPGANLGWEYAVFEPVHGSAPDIAGRGLANPVATLLSAALMLSHVNEPAAADAVRSGIRDVLSAEGAPTTRDLGGSATTAEFAGAIAAAVRRRGGGGR